MSLTSTTPTAGDRPAPSTEQPAAPRPAGTTPLRVQGGQITTQPRVGDIVLIRVDEAGTLRPMIISRAEVVDLHVRTTPTTPPEAGTRELRLCGTIFAEPDDHTRTAFRGWAAGGADPARITGRPDRLMALGYGEWLASGSGVGQWRLKGGR